MSRLRRFDIIERSPSFFLKETSFYTPKFLTRKPCFPSFPLEDDELHFTLDLPSPFSDFDELYDLTSPFGDFDTITDLVQFERTLFYTSTRKSRVEKLGTELYLQTLCNRVSELELGLDWLAKSKAGSGDRKYTWMAEINSPEKYGVDRKYKWVTEIKGDKKETSYERTAEIKGEDPPISRTYTFKASTGNATDYTVKKVTEKPGSSTRLVEIQEFPDRGTAVLRKAFERRPGAWEKIQGKKKDLSEREAAKMILKSYKDYKFSRSQAVRAFRDLAVAKAELKYLREEFNNFSYRSRLLYDAEERQRITDKISDFRSRGAGWMVRSAKRSVVDELESMLCVVNLQPPQGQGRYVRVYELNDTETVGSSV